MGLTARFRVHWPLDCHTPRVLPLVVGVGYVDVVVAIVIIVSYSFGLDGARVSVVPNDPTRKGTGVGAAS